jgi:HEAT repeat protein
MSISRYWWAWLDAVSRAVAEFARIRKKGRRTEFLQIRLPRRSDLNLLLVLCVSAIGCARDPVADLTSRLGNSDVAVRRAAARVLNETPNADERVIAALTKCASDSDLEVRYLSIGALGKLGPAGKAGIPALKSALADSEKRVRVDAALAMHKIDPHDSSSRPVLIAAIREGDGRTLLAIGAMGGDAAWAVPTLVGLLSHETPQVRALAARTLGRIGPAASSAKVSLEAAGRDSNPAVQNAAKEALTRLGNSAGAPAK